MTKFQRGAAQSGATHYNGDGDRPRTEPREVERKKTDPRNHRSRVVSFSRRHNTADSTLVNRVYQSCGARVFEAHNAE